MRRSIPALAVLALAVPLARADEKADAAKKLNGTYTLVALVVDGKPDDKKDDVAAFVLKDGTITVKTKSRDDKATFALDPSKKPAHFDITPDKEKDALPGIYEVKETAAGSELTIAFSSEGAKSDDRPKDFKGGPGVVIVKLLRKKDK